MAICQECSQDMLTAAQCTANLTIVFPDGQQLAAVPFGSEQRCPLTEAERPHVRCGDCNVRPGGAHHPGCDQEECPRCGRQLISCGCFADVDPTSQPEPLASPQVVVRASGKTVQSVDLVILTPERSERLIELTAPRAITLLFSLVEALDVGVAEQREPQSLLGRVALTECDPPSRGDAQPMRDSPWPRQRTIRRLIACLMRLACSMQIWVNRREGLYAGLKCERSAPGFIVQLLSDVRHLCDAHALDFGEIDREAYQRYLQERASRAPQEVMQ